MADQAPNYQVLLHNVTQILEMIRSRETNSLLFFIGLVFVNAAVAGSCTTTAGSSGVCRSSLGR